METLVKVTTEQIAKWKQQHLNEGHSLPSTETYYSFIKKYVGEGREISQEEINIFRKKNMSHVASASLKSFFTYLVNYEAYPEWILNIRYGKSNTIKKQSQSVTDSEVLKLIQAMPTLKEQNTTILIYYLGLRISEALKLLWSDFDWDTWIKKKEDWGVVNLRHTKGDKFRTIPVPSKVMLKIYTDHCKSPENVSSTGIPLGWHVCNYDFNMYVFDQLKDGHGNILREDKETKINRIREEQYRYMVHAESQYREVLYKVSMETLGKRINPHRLRHAQAQELMNQGMGIEHIKSFLGHSSISSTEIYAKSSPAMLLRELKKIEENKHE